MEFHIINEEIISSKKDSTDYQIVKERFDSLYATGRYKNLRDIKWEFIRRSENKGIIAKIGKDKIYNMLETLFKRKK